MADRKEPPFYDDDSVGAFRYKLPFYDTMELFIETLTGTCFELRVSPFETVMSVKAKIQRLEGIPVAQQHLIWNNLELEDEYCLHDYSIAEGCTLKLVLALRGGPINTRRVAMEDPVREMADLVEGGKEEGWEKSLPNKQITFLVYREGDQLNFFRVVDRGDGTLTPVSESLSGGSVCNAYAEEDEEEGEEGGCGFSAGRQSRENSITMNKMKLLKAKMEDMNLNKKPKKSAKLKPRPPVGPRPCGGSFVPPGARPHRLLRVLPQTGQSQHPNNAQLPPIRDQHQSASPSSSPPAAAPAHLSVTRRAPPSFASSSCYMLREEEPWESCPALAKLRPPPKVSRLDACGARLMRDCVYPPLPALSARGGAEEAREPARDSLGPGSLEDAAGGGGGGLMEPSQARASYGDLLSDPLSLDVSTPAQGGAPGELDGIGAELGSAPTLLSQAVGPAGGLCTWGLGPADKPGHALHASPGSPSLPASSSSSSPPPLPAATVQLPRPFEFTGSTLLRPNPPTRPGAPATPDGALPLPSSSSSPPRAARLRGVKADSPCKRTPSEVIISKSEARGVARTASQARKEPLGFLSNAELLASLASREGLGQSLGLGSAGTPASGLGRLGPASAAAAAALPASIQLLQDDLLRRMSPLHRVAASYTSSSGLGSAGGASSSIRRLGTPTYHLPPVKAAAASKKKSSKHCFLCGKKTGLATSYECRCGNNFCATHRYAETHDCTYDYKSAGRRFLQETNPIINAPKLPKI